MDWGTIILLALAVLGAAFMVGGVIAYRGSARLGVRALGAASVAAGVMMLAIVLLTAPVSQFGGPSAPVIAVENVTG